MIGRGPISGGRPKGARAARTPIESARRVARYCSIKARPGGPRRPPDTPPPSLEAKNEATNSTQPQACTLLGVFFVATMPSHRDCCGSWPHGHNRGGAARRDRTSRGALTYRIETARAHARCRLSGQGRAGNPSPTTPPPRPEALTPSASVRTLLGVLFLWRHGTRRGAWR